MSIRYVVFHSPGENWNSEFDFREQPGINEHVEHYSKLFDSAKLFIGGPFVNSEPGGMMISEENVTLEEIEKFAAADPAVKNGLLKFEVKSWYTAMSKI